VLLYRYYGGELRIGFRMLTSAVKVALLCAQDVQPLLLGSDQERKERVYFWNEIWLGIAFFSRDGQHLEDEISLPPSRLTPSICTYTPQYAHASPDTFGCVLH
jgi:hypothetical protein